MPVPGSASKTAVDEHHVRRLLSAARRADLLQGDELAEEFQQLTGSASIGEALKKLVDLTFKDLGHIGSRLSELILKSDLDGTLSFNEVASAMGLSLRQFFRYRARAVQMLASQLRAILRHPVEPADALGALFDTLVDWNPEGALDVLSSASHSAGANEALRALKAFTETAREIPAAIFEQVQQQSPAMAFALRSQHRCLFGDVAGAEEDLRRAEAALHGVAEPELRRAVQREVVQARFLAARNAGSPHAVQRMFNLAASTGIELDLHESVHNLEFLCYAGNFANIEYEVKRHMAAAQRQHDPLAAARLCMIFATAVAQDGDLRRARLLASAARIAAEHHVWLSAEARILEQRIALLSGMANVAGEQHKELPEPSWHRTMIESIAARQFLAAHRLMEAKSLSMQCFTIARDRGYNGLAAYSECTMAAVDGLEGRSLQERERYLRAWAWYVKSKDFGIGLDLFTPPSANWRQIGVFDFADIGLSAEKLDDAQTRHAVAALIPLAERRGWLAK